MEITYRYYCNNKAGFEQHKTTEQWRKENPGVWERLTPINQAESTRDGLFGMNRP